MYTADEILCKVNEYINNLTYDRKPQSLYDPIKYVLSLGGKRIRPTLMLLAYISSKMIRRQILVTGLVPWRPTITIRSCMMT